MFLSCSLLSGGMAKGRIQYVCQNCGAIQFHDRAVIARLATGASPIQKPDARGERRRGVPPSFKGRGPAKPAATDAKEKP